MTLANAKQLEDFIANLENNKICISFDEMLNKLSTILELDVTDIPVGLMPQFEELKQAGKSYLEDHKSHKAVGCAMALALFLAGMTLGAGCVAKHANNNDKD